MRSALGKLEQELWPGREPSRYWGDHAEAPRGEYGGTCFRAACGRPNAHWRNEMNGRHYCGDCARSLNDISRRAGHGPVCELHL